MGTIIRNVKHNKKIENILPPNKNKRRNTNSGDDCLFKEHAWDVGEKYVFFQALVGTLALKRQRVLMFAMLVWLRADPSNVPIDGFRFILPMDGLPTGFSIPLNGTWTKVFRTRWRFVF